jgi:hypothetical protein
LATLKIISDLLKQDRNQRILYGIGLLVWIVIWINQFGYFTNWSGFQYLWFIIPTLLLIGQLLFNNKILWGIIIVLVSAYSLLILWNFLFLEILIDFHRDYAPTTSWNLKKYLTPLLFLTIVVLSNWILWKIKPSKNTLHNNVSYEKQ